MKKTMLLLAMLSIFILACGGTQKTAPESQVEKQILDALTTPPAPPSIAGTPADDAVQETEVVADTTTTSAKVVEIDMIAKQFEFIPGVIEVNEGDTVKIHVTSTDVAHGLAIPEFGVRESFDKGEMVDIEFVADKKGEFNFFCSVPCGSGHRAMSGTLIVN
tara:strand:- start:6202 stop:6687 length:486 start_codon:yes stop_codon:yes gene_type:complete